MKFDLTYLSLGAGVQSTAVYIMSMLGLYDCPRADLSVFADTGDEPQWVYDHLDRMITWSKSRDDPIPIKIVSNGCLSEDIRTKKGNAEGERFASIPAFTQGADGRSSLLRRQCTREYKIYPIEQFIRTHLGYEPRQRVKEKVRCLLGISVDEVTRMKECRTAWVTNHYPLVEARIDREKCKRIIEEAGLEIPRKSSCVYCPFHSDAFWLDLRENHPDEWQAAVEFDKTIRDMSRAGVENPIYLHRSLRPLDEVHFKNENQMDLFQNECEGMCGV